MRFHPRRADVKRTRKFKESGWTGRWNHIVDSFFTNLIECSVAENASDVGGQ